MITNIYIITRIFRRGVDVLHPVLRIRIRPDIIFISALGSGSKFPVLIGCGSGEKPDPDTVTTPNWGKIIIIFSSDLFGFCYNHVDDVIDNCLKG